jgi:hypothetical protein
VIADLGAGAPLSPIPAEKIEAAAWRRGRLLT